MTAPTAVLIAGNSSANLSCQAAAGNVEATTWLKDGRQLTASERVVFAADMSSVKINPLQKEDNGEYVCELSNPVNKAQDSYKMVVNCECLNMRLHEVYEAVCVLLHLYSHNSI